MGRINSLNIRVSGSDLRVETVSTEPAGFAPWSELLSLAQWQTNTGLTALQYINAQDSTSVTIGAPDLADKVEDKTANNHDIDFDPTSKLVNLSTTNGILAETSSGFNSTVCASLTGNAVSNPIILGYCFQLTRLPTATETLFSLGATASDVFRSLEITTSGYIQYAYKDNSGNTLTKTGATVIPFDRKIMVFLFLERTKVRVFLHDGVSLDHAIQITNEGAFNVSSTLDIQAINCKSANGDISQQRASGHYFGHILAEAVSLKTYDIIEQTCAMFGVPFALTDISTLDSGLVSLIQGPGAGNLATPKADVVDLVSGLTFTATGTIPTAGDGKFHKALNLTNVASSIFTKATVPAIWDIYSGSYGDYTLFIRHKTGTTDASTRNIICLNTVVAPTTQNVRIQQSTTQTFVLIVDNVIKATSTATVASDTWYDIVVKGASGVHTFSVNGETPITFTPGTRSTVGGYFGLGCMFTAASTIQHPGRGLLDVAALWNRALTSDEIIQLRKGGNGLDGMFHYLTEYEDDITPPSVVAGYRGPAVAGTNNNNIYMCSPSTTSGTNATYLSFKAPKAGLLREVSLWWKTNKYVQNSAPFTTETVGGRYGRGTGGVYTLSVRTDDGTGKPSATVVSQITGITMLSMTGNTSLDYRKHTFTTIGAVTKGQQLHMMIINTDANPSLNWVCINGVGISDNSAILNKPTRSGNLDWGLKLGLRKNGGAAGGALDYAYYAGTALDITFYLDQDSNGVADYWFGNPYVQPYSYYTGAVSTPFGGTTRLRQILPIASTDGFTVQSVNVAACRVGSPGDMTCRLLASNGTTVLGSCTISTSNYPAISGGVSTSNYPSWGKGTFSSPIALSSSTTYYLEIYSSGSNYYPCVLQDSANAYGGPSGIIGESGGWYGTGGYLQISTNSGSSYSNYMGGDKDLAFYFDVTVP
jgi:hypothetical protein